MRLVILQREILEPEGEDILHLRIEPHRRQRIGRAAQLLADRAGLARMSQAALAFSRAHQGATVRNLAICERLLGKKA